VNAVRSTGQRDIGAGVDNYFALARLGQCTAHQLGKVPGGKLLGPDLDHLHAVAGSARGDLQGIGDAIPFQSTRRSRLGNSTTQSFTPLYFSMEPPGTSTAMPPENSRRSRSGFSTVRSSVAGI